MRYIIPAIVLVVLTYIGTKIYSEMSANQKETFLKVILFIIGILLGLIIFANNI